MSLTPTPNFAQMQSTAKSFWDRKEGTLGKWVLIVGGLGLAAVAFFFWGLILPFIIGAVGNTIQLAALLGVLGVLTSPLWSSTVRLFMTNAFQLSVRWGYQKMIAKDPIGMLRNNVLTLQKQGEDFNSAVSSLAGSKQRLEKDISDQMASISHDKDMATAAARKIDQIKANIPKLSGNDRQEALLMIQNLTLSVQGSKQTAGISLQTINSEKPLLKQTNMMYDQLSRLRNLAQFKVASLTQQANMYEKQRATILASQRALGAAGRILRGDPQQLAIVDQTIDFLNNEAADTIGAMSDFNRWSEKYLTDMDVQNDAFAEEATKMFSQMEAKLQLPDSVSSVVTSDVGTSDATPVTTSLLDDFPDVNAPTPVPVPIDTKKK